MYNVLLVERAEKKFAKLSKELQRTMYEKFEQMREDPFILPLVQQVLG